MNHNPIIPETTAPGWEDAVCPVCKGGLSPASEVFECNSCQRRYQILEGGVPDFVVDKGPEHEHYFSEYEKAPAKLKNAPIDFKAIEAYWKLPGFSERWTIIEAMGELSGKRVLVVGGGRSEMMLYLLERGAEVTFTDLAASGPAGLRERIASSSFNEKIRFAGADVNMLPFQDESFDVVCGVGMVHHLPDPDRFFDEAWRVLKRPGRAVFFDNSYSPAWQLMKKTMLRPFQYILHRRWAISPEDLRATREGGFHDEYLYRLPFQTKFASAGFIRMQFFHYIFCRSVYMWGSYQLSHSIAKRGAPFFSRIDHRLERFSWFRRSTLNLIWWLNKA